jgi:hypothetical protein
MLGTGAGCISWSQQLAASAGHSNCPQLSVTTGASTNGQTTNSVRFKHTGPTFFLQTLILDKQRLYYILIFSSKIAFLIAKILTQSCH